MNCANFADPSFQRPIIMLEIMDLLLHVKNHGATDISRINFALITASFRSALYRSPMSVWCQVLLLWWCPHKQIQFAAILDLAGWSSKTQISAVMILGSLRPEERRRSTFNELNACTEQFRQLVVYIYHRTNSLYFSVTELLKTSPKHLSSAAAKCLRSKQFKDFDWSKLMKFPPMPNYLPDLYRR